MRLAAFISYIAAARACNPERNGHWVVREREHAAEAARALGIRVEDLAKINRVDSTGLNKIFPGETYTVPYVPSLAPPATWHIESITTGTSGCLAYLELKPSSTFTAKVEAVAGIDEQLERWRPGFNSDRQAELAGLFCREKRAPLNATNPGYARELAPLPAKAYAEGYYFYSLLWTGWDQNCTAEETIDTETCIDMMKQSFQKC